MSHVESNRPETPAGPGETRSLGAIVGDISQDMSTLFKQELDLAKTELKQEATRAAKGAGMLGGAGVAAHLAVLILSFALVYLLDNWMPIELGALIVGLLWAAIAGVLALSGRKKIQQANPQLPTTQQTLKEDVQWAKNQKA